MKKFVLFFAWSQDQATNDRFRELTPIEDNGGEDGNNFTVAWYTSPTVQTDPAAYVMCSDFDESEIAGLVAANDKWVAREYNPEVETKAQDMALFGLEQNPPLYPPKGED